MMVSVQKLAPCVPGGFEVAVAVPHPQALPEPRGTTTTTTTTTITTTTTTTTYYLLLTITTTYYYYYYYYN